MFLFGNLDLTLPTYVGVTWLVLLVALMVLSRDVNTYLPLAVVQTPLCHPPLHPAVGWSGWK
jgi:hypothetical protein